MPDIELLADLRALLGEQGVVTGERLAGRVYDQHVGPVLAQVLVRPAATSQVSAVLRLCHARGQPVVPHGGLTGLVFGGSAAALWAVASIAVLVGHRAGRMLDPNVTKRIAAGVFAAIGLLLVTGLL